MKLSEERTIELKQLILTERHLAELLNMKRFKVLEASFSLTFGY